MAEAVGLALAVLPLLVSTAEHYAETATSFKRYRRFASEATNLASKLRIQRTIFRAAQRFLLHRVVGEAQAEQMLEDPHHHGWIDNNTEISLVRQLGYFGDAVVESMRLIKAELESLGKESDKFGEAMEKPPEVR